MSTQDQNGSNKKDLHRLTDIRTKEVSIVDRAANKKRFLVVKRDEGASREEETTMANTKTSTTTVTPAPAPAPAAPVAKAAAGSPTATPAPQSSQGVDPSLYKDGTMPIQNSPGPGTGAVAVPAPVNAADVVAINEDATGAQLTSAPATEPQPAEAPSFSDDFPSAGVFVEASKALGAVMKAVEEFSATAKSAADVVAAAVEKKGAKMAKDRLDSFEKAVDALTKLMKELKGMGIESNPGDQPPRKEPQGEASMPASVAKAAPAEAVIPAGLQVTIDKLGADMAKMAQGLDSMVRVVKSQGDQISKVAKSVTGSNALDPDPGVGAPAVDDVDWPMDLNAVPDRASVKKRGTDFMTSDEPKVRQ